jgi:carbonic anhydrase/acetyltransferase-like protein (isoleucine patch superfamily)
MQAKTLQTTSSTRRTLTNLLCAIIPLLAYALPGFALYLLITSSIPVLKYAAMILSPVLFSFLFVLTAGAISYPFHSGVIPGKFPRDPGHATYSKRKIYGTCWTTIFYCKPVYYFILNSKLLKTLTFRLFGYKGDMNFTVYPDVWIRDMRLLKLGKNAYLSNRSTIGTNICHMDKTISVDAISIGENSIIGHLAMVAHGVEVGDNSEVGVGCAIGIKVQIGHFTTVGPTTTVNHYARIGSNVFIGTKSYIGAAAQIADGIKIPAGAIIPDKANIKTQEQVAQYVSAQTRVGSLV